jgi:hypothetical protein
MRRSPRGLTTSVGSREKFRLLMTAWAGPSHSNLVHLPSRKGSRARRALNRVHDRLHPHTIHYISCQGQRLPPSRMTLFGKLFHVGFDAILITALLAGIKRNTGLT